MAFWTWKTFVTGGVIAVVIGVAALSPVERAPAQAASSGKPVVIELFTSQSCYSCPAAEAYLGELIEFSATSKIFTNPTEKQTEDYVTGRFG